METAISMPLPEHWVSLRSLEELPSQRGKRRFKLAVYSYGEIQERYVTDVGLGRVVMEAVFGSFLRGSSLHEVFEPR